jgi:hypothetical protein
MPAMAVPFGASHDPGVASLPIAPLTDPLARDPSLNSDEVPQLYRSILDLVAELEQMGARREAARGRAEAIAAYSRGWDDAGRRKLERIAERLQRRTTGQTLRGRMHLG